MEIVKNLIVNSSQENDIVLDPFLGSGTTAVAAKDLNRRYIGYEISKEYCQIAKKRIAFDNYDGGTIDVVELCYIPCELLKAINMRCQELGWM